MVKNLNIVLDTTVKHRKDFDETVDNFEKLITGLNNHADSFAAGIANISNGAGTVADLLADNRTLLHKTLNYLEPDSAADHRPERPVRRPDPPHADRNEHRRQRRR